MGKYSNTRPPNFHENYSMGWEAAHDSKRAATLQRPKNALNSAAEKAKASNKRGSGGAERRTVSTGGSYRIIKHGQEIKIK